ncbi:uncharacterized protein VNE69_09140 [Vairimorpha necatrix]|uniref:Uncharacterized protein n=1 Tax=Vairimorpha necatrix TaxID=6039 RepID=A0AAX4JF18_9MICR
MNQFFLFLFINTCINTVSICINSKKDENILYLETDEDVIKTPSCSFLLLEYETLKDTENSNCYKFISCDETDNEYINSEYYKNKAKEVPLDSINIVVDVRKFIKTSFNINTHNIYRIIKKNAIDNDSYCSDYFLMNDDKKFHIINFFAQSVINEQFDDCIFDVQKKMIIFENHLKELNFTKQQDQYLTEGYAYNVNILSDEYTAKKKFGGVEKKICTCSKQNNNNEFKKKVSWKNKIIINGQIYDLPRYKNQTINTEEHQKRPKDIDQITIKHQYMTQLYPGNKNTEPIYENINVESNRNQAKLIYCETDQNINEKNNRNTNEHNYYKMEKNKNNIGNEIKNEAYNEQKTTSEQETYMHKYVQPSENFYEDGAKKSCSLSGCFGGKKLFSNKKAILDYDGVYKKIE